MSSAKAKMLAMSFDYKDSLSMDDSEKLLKVDLFPKKQDDRGPVVTEPKYRRGVLEGNWVAEGATYVPPMYEWSTVYDSTFVPHKIPTHKPISSFIWEAKKRAEGLDKSLLMDHHGAAYLDNYTTTYDLMYRVFPKGTCGPLLRKYNKRKKEFVREPDFTDIFGNITETGLREAARCQKLRANMPDPQMSIQKSDYKKHECYTDKKFHMRKADWEPDLRHLEIDLNAPPLCMSKSK